MSVIQNLVKKEVFDKVEVDPRRSKNSTSSTRIRWEEASRKWPP